MLQHPLLLASTFAYWAIEYVVLFASGVSTDYLYVIMAVSPVVATVSGVWLTWRLGQVHTIVNSQRTALEQRILQLEDTINSSDKDIPATTRETGHG